MLGRSGKKHSSKRGTCEPLDRNFFEAVNWQYCEGKARELLRQKKKKFDSEFVLYEDDPTLKSGIHSVCNLYDPKRRFSVMTFATTVSQGSYFCNWYPELFGIDEDEIPLSEDEEELFGMDWGKKFEAKSEGDEILEKDVIYEDKKTGSQKYLYPKYGRRARQKPILERKNHEKFECLCDIDDSYSRHFIAPYDKGFVKDERDFKPPRFKNVWKEYRSKIRPVASERWSAILESSTEKPKEDGEFLYQPTPKLIHLSKKKLQEYREQVLANFKFLDCSEVRRFRKPYAERLYLKLQEDLYVDSAEFFKNLLKKDHLVHESVHIVDPYLRDNKVMLDKVVQFLTLAERYSRKRNHHEEVTVLLRSGKYFNDQGKHWRWLAEEFYVKAVEASQKSVLDGGEMEAISHYLLGTLLLDFGNRVQSAGKHLLKARELSLGKEWTAEFIVQKPQDPVHKECAIYLIKALIATSKELREKGKPEEALSYIQQLSKLSEEPVAHRWDIELAMLFESGMTYQAVGYLNWAINAFRKCMELALLQNCTESLCESYFEMANCYRSLGDLDQCRRCLRLYLEMAESRKEGYLIASGYRHLGEFHLTNGNSNLAAEFFNKAFHTFHEKCIECLNIPFAEWKPEHFSLPNDVELTRVLTGLATGEALTKRLFLLISEAKDKKNQQEILKLIRWKNNQEFDEREISAEEEKPRAPVAQKLVSKPHVYEKDFFMDLELYINLE